MDSVFYRHSTLFQQVAEFPHSMLGLGRGHTVTRDEHDLVSIGQLDRNIVQTHLAHGSSSPAGIGAGNSSKSAKEHIGDGAVPGLAHQDREDESGKAIK